MLGKDLFKVESNVNISNESIKSLILFYYPLIGAESLALYEFLAIKGSSSSFEELSKLLNSLNKSIDRLELEIDKLNEYKLVNTLKSKTEDKYIFVLNNPLTLEEFIKDDILVRDFIHKTSGEYYQSLLMNMRFKQGHEDFEDISKKMDKDILKDWSSKDETYLKAGIVKSDYNFNTFFNVNEFLKEVSTVLLPIRFRSEENMQKLATLADLYNISFDKMRTFLPRVFKSDSNEFDINQLRYLCENAQSEYSTISQGVYDVPSLLFLMNKQDGKEVTKYDKKMIYTLSNEYHLSPSVINVILEHGLKNCDNRLIEKYIYAIASDLHRNNVNTAEDALNRLAKNDTKQFKEQLVNYSNVNNPELDKERLNDILTRRNNNG